MFREVVLDTETTGLSPESGDKLVEIGIVELINHIPSGKFFHKYINPKRLVPEAAFKIHGLNNDFLNDKPLFSHISNEMLEFIGTDPIIIHNAAFDLNFLNYELSLTQSVSINSEQVIDTLLMARKKFPGSPASLDALCRRFSINNSNRKLHGALLDSHILAQVYLELIGGNQPNLEVFGNKTIDARLSEDNSKNVDIKFRRVKPLPNRLTNQEIVDHKTFISKINGLKNWKLYS